MKMACILLNSLPPSFPALRDQRSSTPLDRFAACPVAQQLFSPSANWQPGLLVWGWHEHNVFVCHFSLPTFYLIYTISYADVLPDSCSFYWFSCHKAVTSSFTYIYIILDQTKQIFKTKASITLLQKYRLVMCEVRNDDESFILFLTSISHKWLCFGCQDISHAHITDRGLP